MMLHTKHGRIAQAIAIPLLLAIIMFAVSCDGKKRADPSEMRFGIATEPKTFDPLNPSNTADGRSILFNVFEGLVKTDTTGILHPCAAESWTVEDDGLIYNFKLRENVRFHDNSLLTAADVKFTFETATAAGFPGFSEIEKIETPSDMEIKLTLKNPDTEFLPYITVGIIKAGNTNREKNINGTGPFVIEHYSAQQSLVLKRFDGYWKKDLIDITDMQTRKGRFVPLKKITIVFMADSNAMVMGLKGGGIDGAVLTGAWAQQMNPVEFDIVQGWSASAQVLALNHEHRPLDDSRVRRALNHGIDVQEIINAAFYGRGEPSGSPLIPGLSAYYEESLKTPYPVNRELAIDLLAQAGFGNTPGLKPLSLEITVPSEYTMHVDTAQVIASQLEKIGIITLIKQVEFGTWLEEVYMNRRYEATVISIDGVTVSPRSFLSRYHSNADGNFFNFSNSDYDRVYDKALAESDEGKRTVLYKEAQRIISQAAAGVYIQDIAQFTVLRGGAYGGVKNYPLYVIDFASMYGIEQTD